MNAAVTPQYDPATGWARNTTTPLGGQRGKNIDAVIAVVAAVNPTIAAILAPYVVGRFWTGADAIFSIGAYDPDRYVVPDEATMEALGLNADQVQQIIWNEQGRSNWYAGMSEGYSASFVQAVPRGVQGGLEVPKYDPTNGGSFIPAGNDQPLTPTQAAQKALTFGRPRPYALVPSFGGHMFPQPMNDQIAFDHFLADIWFDLRTDRDVARLYRQFAVAYGVVAPQWPDIA